MIKWIGILMLAITLCGCKSDPKTASLFDIEKKDAFVPKEEVRQNIGRSSWQKPELLISKMGDVAGKKIADIGAGTGYFSYRLAYRGANVIAIDVDPDMISLMDGFTANLPSEVANRIETRLAEADDPLLAISEVDGAIIINTIAYIEDKTSYLATLHRGIKEGYVMIVDYKNKTLEIPAPPFEERVSSKEVQQHLKAAGFTNIEVDDSTLEYQYVVTGWK